MNEQHPAWKIFHQLVNEGVSSDLLIACSSAYAEQVKRTGERQLPLAKWLETRGWEKYLH
jgi:hypothetical protein